MTVTIEWTFEDRCQAIKEGWDFFDNGHEVQLQRLDDPDDDLADKGGSWVIPFQDDAEAWTFVVNKAVDSTFHAKALAWLKQESPEEWKRVVNWREVTAEEAIAELRVIEKELR